MILRVYEAGTITGGTAVAQMTLASASERIRGLEDSLGAPLLMGDRRGVQMTAVVRTLLHHARLVLQQLNRMQSELGDYATGLKGQVRLLLNTSAFCEHLPEVLSSLLKEYLGISVDLKERSSWEIPAFRVDHLVVAVPHDHHLVESARTCLSDVVDLEFVGLGEGRAL